MPLPAALYVLWAIWPLASYPGGKLFAPLIALIGLFAIPHLKTHSFGKVSALAALLLFWVSLSAVWSPAGEGVFSGPFLGDGFALEASYLRIAFTLIGSFLFLKLVVDAPPARLDHVPYWIYGGLLIHLFAVAGIAFFKDSLFASQGHALVLTGQSMGRNINLVALGAPLLLAGLFSLKDRGIGFLGAGALVALVIALALRLDGLSAVLALVLGGACFGIMRVANKGGFRILFNTMAGAIFLAPAIVMAMVTAGPSVAAMLPLTARQRILIWQATLERIVEAPIFGHGVNASASWTEKYASRPDFLDQLIVDLAERRIIPNHSHNMAMQLWAETGLVGIILICVICVLIGRSLPEPRQLALGPQIAAAGIFGGALAYFAVSYSVWDESFWASVSIAVSGVVVLHRKYPA